MRKGRFRFTPGDEVCPKNTIEIFIHAEVGEELQRIRMIFVREYGDFDTSAS